MRPSPARGLAVRRAGRWTADGRLRGTGWQWGGIGWLTAGHTVRLLLLLLRGLNYDLLLRRRCDRSTDRPIRRRSLHDVIIPASSSSSSSSSFRRDPSASSSSSSGINWDVTTRCTMLLYLYDDDVAAKTGTMSPQWWWPADELYCQRKKRCRISTPSRGSDLCEALIDIATTCLPCKHSSSYFCIC